MRQAQALNVMMSGKSVFLTGSPGAGKTYVLNKFVMLAKQAGKNVAVTASTGIAATHIGGTTIHAWAGIGVKDFLTPWDEQKIASSSKLIKRFNATDILVIDEVSMLHGVRLDMVNQVAKILRQNRMPFGGMQVVLVGDLFQLPPVTRGRGPVDFAHLSAAWAELDPAVCYLTEQHRAVAGDVLLDLLEAMRRGEVYDLHEEALRSRLETLPDKNETVTKLYSHNVDVDKINQTELAALKSNEIIFDMVVSGAAAKREMLVKNILAPEQLSLKRGAEVMFVANSLQKKFVNGTRGVVIDFDNANRPVVVTAGGKEIVVEPHSWSLEEDGRIVAEATQLPLRLAWAITIHKSQGMSLDAAEIDLSRSFTPGMGYVALSRVRSIDGIFLRGINNMALAMHPMIFDFDKQIRQVSLDSAETVEDFIEVIIEKSGTDDNAALFEELRRWRLGRARQDRVAPFMVLHDSTLHELAERKPATKQALKGIKGFGPAKHAKYADDIIELLKKHG